MSTLLQRRGVKKKGNRLSSITFDEVSVVTNPANQHSKIILWKSEEGPPTMSPTARSLIAKRYPRVDIDSLPANVVAAMDELVEDNSRLAKAMIAANERREELQDELDEHDAEIMDNLTLDDRIELSKMRTFGTDLWSAEDDLIADIEDRGWEDEEAHGAESEEIRKDDRALPPSRPLPARWNAPGTSEEVADAEAIAKAFNDNPEFRKRYRQLHLAKAEHMKETVQSDLAKSLTPTEQAMADSANAIATEALRKAAGVPPDRQAIAKAVDALREARGL